MKHTKLFTIFIIFLALLITTVSAQQYNCPMGSGMMGGLYGGYGSGMMLFSWITWILVIVALILFIVWIVKQLGKKK